MNISIDNDYAPGFSETVAAAVVASDDVKLRHLIAMTLREAGVAVKEMAVSGPLCDERVHCQLFVIDGAMMAPSGAIEMLRALRDGDDGDNCALLLLSHCESVEAYNAGADLVLLKPISMVMFMARVRAVMRRYRIII